MKKRIVGAILSIMLPGAGQIYVHQWIKGAFFLIAALFFSGMVRRLSMAGPSSAGLPVLNAPFIHLVLLVLALWSAADLFRGAVKEKKIAKIP